uniref:Conserved oligomeric Golgi complex subunit 1 n=1 Tax=Syphacia muris TaxID=451379 RepID=A0A0N5AM98_9BILA
MDIERLMQDLSIADLQRIYSDLTVDLEGKKEELRQMVGRRYRDVLDASSLVKKVTENAEVFANRIRDFRSTLSDRSYAVLSPNCYNRQQCMQLVAITKLFPLVGFLFILIFTSIGTMDPLCDVFILMLVEMMHKSSSVDAVRSENRVKLINMMSPKLIAMRLRLQQEFVDSLGRLSNFEETANQLAAIAVLNKLSVSELLDLYLDSKTEIELLAASCSELKTEAIEKSVFTTKCSSFLEKISTISMKVIKERCNLFESTSNVLNFLVVLLEAFDEEWPVVGDSDALYQRFFQNLILEKFQHLVKDELFASMQSFLAKIPTINCHPSQFFKKRQTKFEPLLESSISEQLVKLGEQFDSDLRIIYENVQKYESIGKEADIGGLRDYLADAMVEMILAFCNYDLSSEDWSPKERALTMTRVYLAMLRPRNSVISMCLAGNNERISKCVNILQETGEKHLCCFLNALMIDSAEECDVKKITKICADPFKFLSFVQVLVYIIYNNSSFDVTLECLNYVLAKKIKLFPLWPFQEYENVDLPELGVVEVPMQITYVLYDFLYLLCSKVRSEICSHSLSHILTRNIRTKFNVILGNFLLNLYSKVLEENATLLSRIATQYLFDVRVLDCIFNSDAFRHLIPRFEALVDPFDLSIVIFGPHFGEILFTKELPLSPSYTAVLDIVPRIGDVSRFTLISRLNKSKGTSEPLRTVASALNINSRKKLARQGDGVRNTPSLSSLYNWFGK